ncbi:MAG: phosphoribosyl-ATP pyrophosphohydrolase [Candidatus Woesearchaeota archaeon]
MKKYNKLIRDKIPEIIEKAGKDYEIKTLKGKKYLNSLNQKLQEELDEYLEDENVKELANLLEVIYAILDFKGVSRQELEKIRKNEKKNRGGFEKGLYLIQAEE